MVTSSPYLTILKIIKISEKYNTQFSETIFSSVNIIMLPQIIGIPEDSRG